MKKWYESKSGRVSAMRVMAVPGFFISAAAAVSVTAVVLAGNRPELISLVVIWITFAGACLTGKSIQKSKEGGDE